MKMEDTRFENAGFLYMFNVESIFGDTDSGDPIYICRSKTGLSLPGKWSATHHIFHLVSKEGKFSW